MDKWNRSVPVVLRPVGLSWIQGAVDEPADVCAHGHVEFRIGEDVLLDATSGPEVTVSAAALYLLRTLVTPHSRKAPVGDHLFPCCGMVMSDRSNKPDVLLVGCPNGVDFEVLHGVGSAEVMVRAGDGREWSLQRQQWEAAVFELADLVSGFYASSSPKRPPSDDVPGFQQFAAEWERRRGQPLGTERSSAAEGAGGPTNRLANIATLALCAVMGPAWSWLICTRWW